MLAKILEDMWVEPEVLEALSEEQKRILFLKMREEQVRRWRVREEREEKEGRDDSKRPKQADKKHVRWLLGRDGDISVSVIGEVDEFRSSKLLQSLMNNRVHGGSMNVIQPVDLLPGGMKEDIQLSAAVSPDPTSPHSQWSEEEDPQEPAENSDSESGGSSGSLGDWGPLRPPLSNHGDRQPVKRLLSDRESDRGKQELTCEQKDSGGRVSQLRKAFIDTPVCSKPPLPAKPAHLQKRSTALVH